MVSQTYISYILDPEMKKKPIEETYYEAILNIFSQSLRNPSSKFVEFLCFLFPLGLKKRKWIFVAWE